MKNILYTFFIITLLFQPIAALRLYFAGELFDHKHLSGNVLLAQALESLYKDRYTCILPQDLEKNINDPLEIRNLDIITLMQADLALFNFDGMELDSGTVVEFMIAKMLDIPSVVLRTDTRNCGINDAIRWNLMVFGYPRTAIVNHPCMNSYKNGIQQMHHDIALDVNQAFEKIVREPTVFVKVDDIFHAYSSMPLLCRLKLPTNLSNGLLNNIVQSKINRGLYQFAKK